MSQEVIGKEMQHRFPLPQQPVQLLAEFKRVHRSFAFVDRHLKPAASIGAQALGRPVQVARVDGVDTARGVLDAPAMAMEMENPCPH